VLVLRPGALGDTLLAVPALRALRRQYARLTLAAHGGAARLLLESGEVDAAMSFDDPRVGRVLQGSSDAVQPVVAWLDVARTPGLHALVVAPSRPAGEVHCARYLLDTLAPLIGAQEMDERPLRVRPVVSDEVLVHPGSGSAAKNWPVLRFASLIDRVSAARLVVGEADGAAADAVEACLGRAVPRLSGMSVGELASRLAGCRAYVGNDSGVSHLAGLCGARSYVLFGPTSPVVWRPLGPRVRVVDFDEDPVWLAGEVEG
jgi:ADP-heptose:LPS heptosyltransferase